MSDGRRALRRRLSLDATARIVDPGGDDDERQVEAALRPKRLSEFPGQTRVRDQLQLVLEAARRRDAPPDHILLSGPPGLGKTTLAMIVAAELEQPIRITSGPAIQHAGDLASILSSLGQGRGALPRRDPPDGAPGRGDALPRDGGLPRRRHRRQGPRRHRHPAGARAVHRRGRHDPGRAAAGAAARPVRLHRPPRLLRHRRPRHASSSARPGCSSVDTDDAGITEIARRSRGTPRIANRLLRRVRDWAQVHGRGVVDEEAAHVALALFDVDDRGLDRLDRAVLEALCRRFGGGPVGSAARWPSPSGRSPTPSRPSPSRSSCARAS